MALAILTGSLLLQVVAANYHPHLLPRQTDAPDLDEGGDCLSALFEVVGDAPYPPAEIVDVMTGFFMTATGTYDAVCGWQTNLPNSLVDDWYSYQSEVLTWYSDNSDRINSALSACPSEYSGSAGPCTQTIAGLPPPGEAEETGDSNSDSNDDSKDDSKPNGGEGQSGYLIPGTVMGIAAFLGAALLL